MSIRKVLEYMVILLLGILLLWTTAGQPQERLDPRAHFERVMANGHLQVEGQVTGEQFCWHAAHAANDFVDGYLAWGDEAWLEQAAKYFDWLVSLLARGPDGYRGWIGPYIYDDSYWCDVHVGDAILINPMLRFAEVVLADTALSQRHGERANRYVELARRDLIEKWDSRGTWHKDGSQGAYRAWDHYLLPGDLSAWRRAAESHAGLSLPFNKQMDMGLAALRLYRITGEEDYRQRAERIFALFKARLRLFEGGYIWNYWEPLGQWDIDLEKGRIRHWVNIYPRRNYPARVAAFVVEAYHTGVVFTRGDIEGIIHTNLANMWNGDLAAPRWRNAGLGGAWAPQAVGRAGSLWSALVDFDQRARRLHGRSLSPGSIDYAYFHQVVSKQRPSFVRRYTKILPEKSTAPLPPSVNLIMAAALPRLSRDSTEVLLVCKAASDGPLHISLHGGDGSLLDTLYSGHIQGGKDGLEGIFWITWTGAGRGPGSYIVRWQLGDEYREVQIERPPEGPKEF